MCFDAVTTFHSALYSFFLVTELLFNMFFVTVRSVSFLHLPCLYFGSPMKHSSPAVPFPVGCTWPKMEFLRAALSRVMLLGYRAYAGSVTSDTPRLLCRRIVPS